MSGWSGTNVDANQKSVASLRKHRPEDDTIHAAVMPSDFSGETVRFSSSPERPDLAGHVAEAGFEVPAMRLSDLADRLNGPVDYMNVDVEGMDADLICDEAFPRFAPKVLTIEQFSDDIESLMTRRETLRLKELGYSMVGRSMITSIFAKL